MLDILTTRIRQKNRTVGFPKRPPELPDRFRGLPEIVQEKCVAGCRNCETACPTGAIKAGPKTTGPDRIRIDLGRCLFCLDCFRACPEKAIGFSHEYRLAVRARADLFFSGNDYPAAMALEPKMRKLFRRSLKLRQVSAGGCNACEADVNVLNTVVWDLGRFGVQFVASPRHADGLLITGPVTRNMKLALEKTYASVPDPKLVIAAGACAVSGGPYLNRPEAVNGVDSILPVDLYIPGCPPHPATLLDGLLRLIGKIK
jgi:Ni,Fe-hydrogenase III small subunit/formate hydrogenlyase subunit 6/NADH:ubiquinone oxidoreductase subunit I